MDIQNALTALQTAGNLREIPSDRLPDAVDFTSNDYLGLGEDVSLREQFFANHPPRELAMTSSASRLLAGNQKEYTELERLLEKAYGRAALLFNSGYHANTGIIPALAGRSDLILADRLVHASIIDGIKLSGAQFKRFAHNDYQKLENLLEESYDGVKTILVVVESVYSMDGDRADLRRIAELKNRFPGIILYVDEAHAVGVCGPAGLGEAVGQSVADKFDVIIGTFGKALASEGAFASLATRPLREYLVNKSRSLIFSTAIAPAQVMWTRFMLQTALEADTLRDKLRANAEELALAVKGGAPSHIRPLIVGDAHKAIMLSKQLAEQGFNVLPIRTPTVPPGTERLRFSLSAAIPQKKIIELSEALKKLI